MRQLRHVSRYSVCAGVEQKRQAHRSSFQLLTSACRCILHCFHTKKCFHFLCYCVNWKIWKENSGWKGEESLKECGRKVKWKSLSRVWLFATPWTIQSMEFSRPEYWNWFSSIQSLSCVQLFTTPWTVALQALLSITNSQSLPKLMSIELVMPSNHLIPFSSCRQSFPASGSFPMSQFFTSGGQSIGVSASTSVWPVNEHPGLISFRMDWLDFLPVQGTLKSLPQHYSSKASIL